MPIFLRRPLVERLIETRFDTINDLIVEWDFRHSLNAEYPKARQKTAIYDWLDDGVPTQRGRNRHLIFALCGLLDVDPLAILDYNESRYFKDFTQLRMSLYMLSERVFGGGASNFGPLLDMFMPGPAWPNTQMAELFYGRPWFAYEFNNAEHERGQDYGLIKVRFTEEQSFPIKSVHIAYRRRESNDKMWRYYGVVNLIGDRLELYNEGGYHDWMNCKNDNEIWFRTFFGSRPVEFRLVSLHDFTYTTEINNDMTLIGFNW